MLIVATSVVAGVAYGLFWPTFVRHDPRYWLTPPDLWYAVRSAHWVGWGGLSSIYANGHNELVTLPGFEVLLMPVVVLCSMFGLSESTPWLVPNLHPHAWIVIGPVTLASTAVPLFAFDAVAVRLGLGRGRRTLLAILEASTFWSTTAIWGHAEDVLAIGLAVLAFVASLDGRYAQAGWLLGGALAMKLSVVYLVPILLGVVGLQRAAAFLFRAAIVPGCLLVASSVSDVHAAVTQLIRQPAVPQVNHPTPWISLSSRLSHGFVAAGPTRAVGFSCAIGLGFLGWRLHKDERFMIWLMAVAMGLRCVLEPVVVPYYVAPVVAFALLAAASSRIRLLLALTAGLGVLVMTSTRHGEWTYWLSMTAILFGLLATSWPGHPRPLQPLTRLRINHSGTRTPSPSSCRPC